MKSFYFESFPSQIFDRGQDYGLRGQGDCVKAGVFVIFFAVAFQRFFITVAVVSVVVMFAVRTVNEGLIMAPVVGAYSAVRFANLEATPGACRVPGGEVQVERSEGYYGDKEKSLHIISAIYKTSGQPIFSRHIRRLRLPDVFWNDKCHLRGGG